MNDEARDSYAVEELKESTEHTDEIGALLDVFVTRCDVIAMIAEGRRKAKAAMNTDSITSTVEDIFADLIEVGYTSSKEGIKAPILRLAEEALIDAVPQGHLDTVLLHKWTI